jgi:hypothetical protein
MMIRTIDMLIKQYGHLQLNHENIFTWNSYWNKGIPLLISSVFKATGRCKVNILEVYLHYV